MTYRSYLLVVLTVIALFNYVDRSALGLLLQNIKSDLQLSDTQLGFLNGIAFALFYSVMGVPIARWADRGNRVTIITLTTALWSVAVALCGMATSFTQLLLTRVAVAVGEAGCIPPAFSLIADYFNRRERPRASAIYGLAGVFSAVVGYFAAGWLNEFYGWRVTFICMGAPGVALALLAWFTLREPRRQLTTASGGGQGLLATGAPGQPSLKEVRATLWRSRTFVHLQLCLAVMYFFNYGIGQWLPSFFVRSYGLSTGALGTWFTVIVGPAGALGMYLGGEWASRGGANNESLQLKVVAVAIIVAGALMVPAYLTHNMYLSFLLMALSSVGLAIANGPVFATIQTLIPERMRAVAFAIVYLTANLLGMGLGPLAAGVLSDVFREWAGEESLRFSLLALVPGYAWVGWHAWQASGSVARELAAAPSATNAAASRGEAYQDEDVDEKAAATARSAQQRLGIGGRYGGETLMDSSSDPEKVQQNGVRLQWGVRVPLRDGVHLSATLYLPRQQVAPAPTIFTLTPYVAQTYHDRGMFFATHGYPFAAIDVRGRGNSEGVFDPLVNEGRDGFDVVEWLARQPYCNGRVAMWGGSYGGFTQWATAKELPPHLATIVPVAAPYAGVDFPGRGNILSPYLMQWLTLVWGRTSQDRLFWNDQLYWNGKAREWLESGAPFRELDQQYGCVSSIFRNWLDHPHPDAYWDRCNPRPEQYARLNLPILTITGIYDGDQPGALTHYREHLRNAAPEMRARHYLIIGPWDHAGTRTPMPEFCGLKVGADSLVDLPKLHCQWYAWTMQGGPRPEFLQKRVAYYVMVAEKWRYADDLESVTARSDPYYLASSGNPTDVFNAGSLERAAPPNGGPDHYCYDPCDTNLAKLESSLNVEDLTDQTMVHASSGKHLVYHSAVFDEDVQICGFFSLSVWLAIDQPDTDFRASVYDVALDGSAVLLTSDSIRARYRESLREPALIATHAPLRYDFQHFTFVARQINRNHRLRLVLGPINSIHSQRNYNSGGPVAAESVHDARAVTVRLFHDATYPSALYVPLGAVEA